MTRFRVLIVSEGKHELGTKTDCTTETSAALVELVRNVLDLPNDIALVPDVRRFVDAKTRLHPGKGSRLARKAIGWIRDALREGFHAIVGVYDHDGDDGRIAAFSVAQASPEFPLPRAFGVAIRTFDAWMLADEMALSQVLGTRTETQRSPEEIKDAKSHCARIRDDSGAEISLTELYTKLAKVIRVELLEARCPKGFRPFSNNLRPLRDVAIALASQASGKQ